MAVIYPGSSVFYTGIYIPNKQSLFPKHWECGRWVPTAIRLYFCLESHQGLQSQGKARTDEFQFRKWAREWTLGLCGFFFFFFSEMILIEKCGYFSKVATVVNRTFISVINKILGNFLDFSHGKEWKFLHLGAKMSSVFLQHLSVRRAKREKAKINLNSQSYTVTLYQFINVNWSSPWNL